MVAKAGILNTSISLEQRAYAGLICLQCQLQHPSEPYTYSVQLIYILSSQLIKPNNSVKICHSSARWDTFGWKIEWDTCVCKNLRAVTLIPIESRTTVIALRLATIGYWHAYQQL